jgi:hypothetical protein
MFAVNSKAWLLFEATCLLGFGTKVVCAIFFVLPFELSFRLKDMLFEI